MSRWTIAKALIADLADEPLLAQTRVSTTVPGDENATDEMIYVIGLPGAFEDGPSAAGSLINDDKFTIKLGMVTALHPTDDAAMTRIGEMALTVYRRVCATGNLDGLGTADWTLTEIRPREWEPIFHPSPDGAWAETTYDIEVEVRHYGGN